jgi:hypothetical protein
MDMGGLPEITGADEIRFSYEFKISENVCKISPPPTKGA